MADEHEDAFADMDPDDGLPDEPAPEPVPEPGADNPQVVGEGAEERKEGEAKPGDRPAEGGENEPPEDDAPAASERKEAGDDADEARRKRRRPGRRERYVSRLEEENRALRLRLAGPADGAPAPGQAGAGAAPKREDYEEYEDYVTAKAAHQAVQAVREENRKNAQSAEAQSLVSRRDDFYAAGDERFDDFAEVFNEGLPISDAMAMSLLDAEDGVSLAYYLGKNPHVARQVAGLSPHAAAMEMGRISASLAAPPSRNRTGAPPPPKTIGGGSAAASKAPDKMSNEEYRKWRRAG